MEIRVRLYLSVSPLLAGLYDVVRRCSIWSVLQNERNNLAVKFEPRSETIILGGRCLTIFLFKQSTVVSAVSLGRATASTHLLK